VLAVATSLHTGQSWSGAVQLLRRPAAATSSPTSSVLPTAAGNTGVALTGEAKGKGGQQQQTVVAASDDGCLHVWRLAAEEMDGALPDLVLNEHDDIVSCVAAHHDEASLVASGSWDHSIKLWDLQTKAVTETFEGHIAPVYAVQFCKPAPALFLSGAQDKTVRIWDKRQAQLTLTLQRPHTVCSVSTSFFEENIFATGEEDGSANVFDSRNLAAPLISYKRQDSVRVVRFSPHTSHYLAVASDDTSVVVVDTKSNQPRYSFSGHTDFVRGLAWDPEQANALATGGWDRWAYFHLIPSP